MTVEELLAKARGLAEPVLGARSARLLDVLMNIEDIRNVGETLHDLLTPETARS
jgi:hypothetical protein